MPLFHEADDTFVRFSDGLPPLFSVRLYLSEYNVFIVDTIGLLTKIYSYADIAYVGGGMGTAGLHNILEPAAFGIPIIIGKNFQKFPEAVALKTKGGLFAVGTKSELKTVIDTLVQNENKRENIGKINKEFVAKNRGATPMIVSHILKNS